MENEPYGGRKGKFNDDAVLDKLNDFADSAHKIGESIYKRISQSDFFSRASGSSKDNSNANPSIEISVGTLDPETAENNKASENEAIP